MAKLTEVAPVLLVGDVAKASDYYREKLGFDDIGLFGEPPDFAIVRRDQLAVMLVRRVRG
jgi:hypothetical protein